MNFKAATYGKYFLLERLAIGGMAEVFKAKTFGVHGFERLLVIKRILPHLCEDEEFVEMFIDEAKISVELSHPNIAQTFDLGKIAENYFIAMEYIDGKDLRALLRKLKGKKMLLNIDQAIFIAIDVLKGLDYAHNKLDPVSGKHLGIIHRDISPQNIMISYDGGVKIVDFGIAKAESKLSRTQAGVLKGKFGYMSPEQAAGGQIDARTDIFSLGIVLFEMLTGKRLFLGDSDFETLEMIKKAEVPKPSRLRPEIPEIVDQLVLKALQKDPEGRYQNAKEFQIELTKYFYQAFSDFTNSNLALYMKEKFNQEISQEQQRMSVQRSSLPMKDILQAEINASRIDRLVGTSGSTANAVSGKVTMTDLQQEKDQSLRSSLLGDKKERLPPTLQHQAEDGQGKKGVNIRFKDILGSYHRARPEVKKKVMIGGAILLGLLLLLIIWPSSKKENKIIYGDLIITSNPQGATVKIDNNHKGVTPLSVKLPLGAHQILVSQEGYKDWSSNIFLEKDVVQKIDAGPLEKKLLTASLTISSTPEGATIYFNDSDSGKKTPATLQKITPGKQFKVSLKKEGFLQLDKYYVFDSAKNESRSYQLEKIAEKKPKINFLSLLITSEPEGARVIINGRRRGKTPLTLKRIIKNKTYTVVLRKSGYKSISKKIKLARQFNQRDFTLRKSFGKVSINAIPWANIIINGKKIGETPIVGYQLPTGSYTLEYNHPDFGTYREKFTLKEGQLKVFKKKLNN